MVNEKFDQWAAALLPSKQSAVPWCHAAERPGALCARRTCESCWAWKAARGTPPPPVDPPPVQTTEQTDP